MVRWQWSFRSVCPISLLLLGVCLIHAPKAFSARPTIIDDRGRTIELKAPAKRVIALYGAFNEIIFALGKGEVLVARTKADKDPKEILSLPEIGTHMRPNVEMILSLSPDLVLQSTGRKAALEPVSALERLGIAVAVFNPNSFSGLYSTIRRVGVLLGAEKRAVGLVKNMQQATADIQRRYGHQKRPRVFFEVRYPNLLSVGASSIVNDIIEAAGGINCFGNRGKKFVRPSFEAVLKCDPDYYIIQVGPMNHLEVEPPKRPNFRLLRAIDQGRWRVVDERLFSRPTQNAVRAVEELARILHQGR